MDLTNAHVLNTFRGDLLNPKVIERALSKLESHLSAAPDDSRVTALEAERARLSLELERLAAGLAAGGSLTSLLAAIRTREERLQVLASEVHRLRAEAGALTSLPVAEIMPEVRRRLDDWQVILSEESSQGRRMLRSLLVWRLVFTPDLAHRLHG